MILLQKDDHSVFELDAFGLLRMKRMQRRNLYLTDRGGHRASAGGMTGRFGSSRLCRSGREQGSADEQCERRSHHWSPFFCGASDGGVGFAVSIMATVRLLSTNGLFAT